MINYYKYEKKCFLNPHVENMTMPTWQHKNKKITTLGEPQQMLHRQMF